MKLESLLDRPNKLPTIPKVTQQLMRSFGDENVTIEEIARHLSADPTMSAKLLRLANSAYFNLSRTIGTVDDALRMLGRCLVDAGRPTEAEPVLRECVKLFETHSPKNWVRYSALGDLGASLLEQRRYAEAEPLLLTSYQELKQREGKNIVTGPLVGDDYLTEGASRLVKLYEALGKQDSATEWRKKSEPTPKEKRP